MASMGTMLRRCVNAAPAPFVAEERAHLLQLGPRMLQSVECVDCRMQLNQTKEPCIHP